MANGIINKQDKKLTKTHMGLVFGILRKYTMKANKRIEHNKYMQILKYISPGFLKLPRINPNIIRIAKEDGQCGILPDCYFQ